MGRRGRGCDDVGAVDPAKTFSANASVDIGTDLRMRKSVKSLGMREQGRPSSLSNPTFFPLLMHYFSFFLVS